MHNIVDRAQKKINSPERHTITIHDNNINKYIKDLEEKIKIMKKAYIETLVKKHFEKDENKKMLVILQGNVPKTRNDVKKSFNQLINYIKKNKNDLGEVNQKHYYLLILNMLKKYDKINEDEMKQTMKIIMKKRYNKKISNDKKEIKDDKNNYEVISKNDDGSKSRAGTIFKVFTVVLPLAYIINYAYANFKA